MSARTPSGRGLTGDPVEWTVAADSAPEVLDRMIDLGEMRRARKDLAGIIRLRFPALLTPDVERAIADQLSLPPMQTWLDAALDPATTAESFLAVLRR